MELLAEGYDSLMIDIYEDTVIYVGGMKIIGPDSDAMFQVKRNNGAPASKVGRLSYQKNGLDNMNGMHYWGLVSFGTTIINDVGEPLKDMVFAVNAGGSSNYNDNEKREYGLHGNIYINSIHSLPLGSYMNAWDQGCIYDKDGNKLTDDTPDAAIQLVGYKEGITCGFGKWADSDILIFDVSYSQQNYRMNRLEEDFVIANNGKDYKTNNFLSFANDDIYKSYVDFYNKNYVRSGLLVFYGYHSDAGKNDKAYSYKKLKKKAQSFKLKVTTSLPEIKFAKVSGNSKIKVSANGKVTVAKGLKKGKYKVKYRVYSPEIAST